MMGFSGCFCAGAALLGAAAGGCAPRRLPDAPPTGAVTPEIRGVLRPGDPYGAADDVVPGHRVGVAVGDSAARCHPVVAEAVTDSAGRFLLPPAPRPTAGPWFLCLGLAPGARPVFPAYRGEEGTGPGGPLQLECEVHGDAGSPECVRGRASRSGE